MTLLLLALSLITPNARIGTGRGGNPPIVVPPPIPNPPPPVVVL